MCIDVRERIRSGPSSDIRENRDPLNLGLTEHTASHLGECSGRVGLFGLAHARCSCITASPECVAYVTMTSGYDVTAGESRHECVLASVLNG